MTAPAPTSPRRPRNRKALILTAASREFAERGYHAVGMEDIALAVGISGPALYRHFPSKYALFARCAHALARELLDDWPPAPLGADLAEAEAARAHLDDVVVALVRTTLRNRRSGGIYRWEGRYLEAADRVEVGALFDEMVARIAALVGAVRQQSVDDADADLLAAGVLAVVASLTAHHTSTAVRRTTGVMVAAAGRLVRCPMPPVDADPETGGEVASSPVGAEPASRRDQVLAAALHLFHSEGFTETTVEAISAAAGLAPSGFYRHFSTKADVLLAACLLASEHLDATVAAAGVRGAPPEVGLRRLARAYVAHSFAHREQMSVYSSSVVNLPAADQARLRALQREHVGLWTDLLLAARPDLETVEARMLVHAALGVVTDLGRRVRWRRSPGTQERIHRLVLAVLGVDEEAASRI